MSILEEMTLTDSIEIKTTPEKIFDFLTHLVDDESYKAWHEKDHVKMQWLRGIPWVEGSVVYAEEYIHGKLHKFKFEVTKVVPNERIEYVPTSEWLRRYFPKNEFIIENKGDICIFTAKATYKVGWIVKRFFHKALDNGLSCVKKHMKEEGENLKAILERE